MGKYFEASIKILCRKWEGETLPKSFFIYKQLDKCQNEYYPDNPNLIRFFQTNLFPSSNIPYFSAKEESVIILKMTNV